MEEIILKYSPVMFGGTPCSSFLYKQDMYYLYLLQNRIYLLYFCFDILLFINYIIHTETIRKKYFSLFKILQIILGIVFS